MTSIKWYYAHIEKESTISKQFLSIFIIWTIRQEMSKKYYIHLYSLQRRKNIQYEITQVLWDKCS